MALHREIPHTEILPHRLALRHVSLDFMAKRIRLSVVPLRPSKQKAHSLDRLQKIPFPNGELALQVTEPSWDIALRALQLHNDLIRFACRLFNEILPRAVVINIGRGEVVLDVTIDRQAVDLTLKSDSLIGNQKDRL